jgi:hypothetical protein
MILAVPQGLTHLSFLSVLPTAIAPSVCMCVIVMQRSIKETSK